MNYHQHRNDARRNSDVLYMYRNQTDRRQKVRRQSYAINQEARAVLDKHFEFSFAKKYFEGLDQLRNVRKETNIVRRSSVMDERNAFDPTWDRTEGARRLHRAGILLEISHHCNF